MMAVSKEVPLRRGAWNVGGEVSVIVTASIVMTGLTGLAASSLGQFLGFGFRHPTAAVWLLGREYSRDSIQRVFLSTVFT